MEFLKKLYYNVGVSEVQSINDGGKKQGKLQNLKFCKNFVKKTIDNFSYQKYNGLVMQLGISKNFKKKKGECINHEKAD